ncbi:MAG: hypothetical protein IKL37_00560 [Alphaproteobacteria bacterium]|nr:hypothetical protein [Alphaproteobacteria bacterium]
MAIDIKKYMSDLVRQLNLRHMDEPRRAQLKAWQKDGRATGKQKGWDPDAELPNINSAVYRDGSAGTVYDDHQKIREELVLLARDLAADSSLEDNKDVQGFLKDFYGAGKAIPEFEIAEIPEAAEIAQYIKNQTVRLAARLQSPDDLDEDKLGKLADALSNGTYKTDPKAHKTLQAFLSKVQYTHNLPQTDFPPSWKNPTTVDDAYAQEVLAYITESDGITPKAKIVELLNNNSNYWGGGDGENEVNNVIYGLYRNDAKAVETVLGWIGRRGDISLWPKDNIPNRWKDAGKDEFDIDKLEEEKESVASAGDLNVERFSELQKQLKTPSVARRMRSFTFGGLAKIFDRIISKDKLRDAVTAHGGDVAKWVSKGMDESNYKDGTDKVPPKIADKKRLFGRATNAVSGYYNNTWGKLFDKHKRHVYKTDARYVVEALFKANIKPTDGLGKVMEKLDDIANSQPGPVAKQIKWMKETLEPMSKTTQFKEALTHGGQMQKVVSDVIAAAAHNGSEDAMQAAEMTLETLAVMQSTMVTSGVREELHKMDFTIFSDPSMSFNKGAMGIFTKALDKTLRFATLAAYEAGNFVVNAIKKSGGKIKKDKITEAAGKAVSDEEMRRIELQVFWNFINSNANTDLNVLKRHSKKQNAADEKAKDEHGNDMAEFKFKINGQDRSRKDPTVKEVEFLNYMIKHGYAQEA